jgi:hypothetical protein
MVAIILVKSLLIQKAALAKRAAFQNLKINLLLY